MLKILALQIVLNNSGTFFKQVGSSDVHKFVDGPVVCYVIPQAYCRGECAYGPAISCVKI